MAFSTTLGFINFCKHQHDVECNQKYNKTLPYSFHLELVAKQAVKWGYLIEERNREIVILGAWGHDLIEDARITYNDIVQFKHYHTISFPNKKLADIIYSCTELRGRNRSERHGPEYVQGLQDNRLGLFVKLCDIAANVGYGLLTNSPMYEKYQEEFPQLELQLYREEFKDLFDYIGKLLTI